MESSSKPLVQSSSTSELDLSAAALARQQQHQAPARRSVSDFAKRLSSFATRPLRRLSRSSSSSDLPQALDSVDIAQHLAEVDERGSPQTAAASISSPQNGIASPPQTKNQLRSPSPTPPVSASPSMSPLKMSEDVGASASTDSPIHEERRTSSAKSNSSSSNGTTKRSSSPTSPSSPPRPSKASSRRYINSGAPRTATILGETVEKVIPFNSEKNARLSSMVTVNESAKLFFDSMEPAKKSELREKDEEGNTPLHWACFLGQLDVVRLLIKSAGAKVNDKNKKGASALHSACCKVSSFHTRCAEALVNASANVNAKNNNKESALHYCCGRVANLSTARVLLRAHAQTNVKDANGRTPLHLAAKFGHLQLCNLLISDGRADFDAADDDGFTPLHYAVIAGQTEVVALLLIHNASLLPTTIDGTNAVHVACKYGRAQILDLLLTHIRKTTPQQPSFNTLFARDHHGFTPVHWAVHSGSLACLQLFPNFLDLPDNIGLTPIFWAALKGNRPSMHYLLSKHPNMVHPVFGKSTTAFLHPVEEEFLQSMKSPLFADVTIQCGETKFAAHKVIVIRCLKNIITDPKMDYVRFPSTPPIAFNDFMVYMYTGRIPRQTNNVLPLLQIANNLGLPILRQLCENMFLERNKSNNRVSTLPLHLGTILESGQFSDFIIYIDGKAYNLHKLVLTARCPYFRDRLTVAPDQPSMVLEGVNKHTFRAVLEYIYTDAIKSVHLLHEQEIVDVLELALLWQLPRLGLLCEYYLFERVTEENVVDFLEKKEYSTLYSACVDFAAYSFKSLKRKQRLQSVSTIVLAEIKKRKKELKERTLEEKKQGASAGTSLFRSFQRRSFNVANLLHRTNDNSEPSRAEDRFAAMTVYEDPATVSPDSFFANKPVLELEPTQGRPRRF